MPWPLQTVTQDIADSFIYLLSASNKIENCLKLKTGARGLQTEVEKCLMPHMFHVSKYPKKGHSVLNITRELINNPTALI